MNYVDYDQYACKKENPKWFLSFAVGIMLGVFLFLWNKGKFTDDACFFGEEILKRFGYSTIYKEAFFYFVCKNRLKIFFLLVIAAFTSLFPFVISVFFGWCGLSAAVIGLTMLSKYGWKGAVLFVGMLLPQMLIYVPCFLYLSKTLWSLYQERRVSCTCTCGEAKRRGFPAWGMRIAGQLCLTLLLLMAGILLESYVNPIVVKKLIKIF